MNAGIAHIVLMENGLVRPGELIIGTDSHSTIYGALGAFGTGVGFSEITAAWVTGKLWMRVPESIKIVIDGPLPAGTYPKDVMLKLIGDLTADGRDLLLGGVPRVVRRAAVGVGADDAVQPGDGDGREERLRAHRPGNRDGISREAGVDLGSIDPLLPDADAQYRQVVTVDGRALSPQIAIPHTVDNVVSVDEVAGLKLDQVFIGSCANAKYDDLAIAAKYLAGHKVAKGVRLVVTPASAKVMAKAAADGIITTLIEAGAMITNPGCGACAGNGGAMADGEVTLSTANRNFRGRMGSYQSSIYLSSPATAAVSAIRGVITNPGLVLQ